MKRTKKWESLVYNAFDRLIDRADSEEDREALEAERDAIDWDADIGSGPLSAAERRLIREGQLPFRWRVVDPHDTTKTLGSYQTLQGASVEARGARTAWDEPFCVLDVATDAIHRIEG